MVGDKNSMDGRVVVVTGASSGFGEHFSKVIAAQGGRVVAAARRADRLAKLVEDINSGGGEAVAVSCDVTDGNQIVDLFDRCEAEFGPADTLVNNAGMNNQGFATELSEAEFDQIMSVNVRGVFLCAREAARRMISNDSQERGHGRIVNIASIGAHTVLPALTTYCTSKAAVTMMTQSLAREWARKGINCNAICPGYVETELNSEWFNQDGGKRQIASFPRKRLMRETDLDDILLYLASDRSAYVTGSIITIDDGQSL